MADARFPLGDTEDLFTCPGIGPGESPDPLVADSPTARAAVAYARTVLTMHHVAELLLPGRRAGRVRYIEEAGKPYLLLRNGPPIAAATVAIRVPSFQPDLSELVVIAELAEPVLGHSDALAALTAEHRTCGGRDRSAGLFRLMPLTPQTVLLPTWGQLDRPVVVELDSYLTAEVDPYDVVGDTLARHLTVAHPGLLRSLLPADAQVDLAAAVAQDITAAGLTVRAINPEGSKPYQVRFRNPATHPHHFGTLLAAGSRDQSTSAE